VADKLPALPLVIIGSYRSDERPALPDELPTAQVIQMERLNDSEIAELSHSMLGDAGRDRQILTLLKRETEGNVFFLVEVVRFLAEEAGSLEQIVHRTLPRQVFAGGIQRLLQRRLDQVPEWGRQWLLIGAVIGRELDLDVMRHVTGIGSLDDWLAACADAAVLEVRDRNWRFVHNKLREHLLAEMPPELRVDLHRQVALAIESVHDAGEQASALAHFWQIAGSLEKERHYAAMAGERALQSGAYRPARGHFMRALSLTGEDDLQGRAWLTSRLGEVYFWVSEHSRPRAFTPRV